MGGEIEAAGDVLTGAAIAKTIEGHTASKVHNPQTHSCLNCGTRLTGAYCVHCGQPAHIHRSLHSLGHDILHGVFHFEGKFWSTLPQLFFFPGRLTRRYIDGERAKFVSPMALYLFTVFSMFAVFSFTTSNLSKAHNDPAVMKYNEGNRHAYEHNAARIAELKQELQNPELTPETRKALTEKLKALRDAQRIMQALAKSGWSGSGEWAEEKPDADQVGSEDSSLEKPHMGFSTPWPALNKRFEAGLAEASENPQLLLYKLKTSGYKYSWSLIVLSVPFIWLLFFWRRDLPLYDHAIFATYSISFMMLLITLVSVLVYFNTPSWLWGFLLMFAPPIHMYKQLRGAYQLSRMGAWIRLMFLITFSLIVLILFTVLLVVLDVIG